MKEIMWSAVLKMNWRKNPCTCWTIYAIALYMHLKKLFKSALHNTFFHSFIPFTGTHQTNKLTSSQLSDFVAQLVRALHRHRKGHGFESCWRHLNFFRCIYETIAYIIYCPASVRIVSSEKAMLHLDSLPWSVKILGWQPLLTLADWSCSWQSLQSLVLTSHLQYNHGKQPISLV